jgi:hypothetical protein
MTRFSVSSFSGGMFMIQLLHARGVQAMQAYSPMLTTLAKLMLLYLNDEDLEASNFFSNCGAFCQSQTNR